jgi:hypothetical protein
MATEAYRPPSLSALLVSSYHFEEPERMHNAAFNASQLLSTTLESIGELLAIAAENENRSIDMTHISTIGCFIREVALLQDEVERIHEFSGLQLRQAGSADQSQRAQQ